MVVFGIYDGLGLVTSERSLYSKVNATVTITVTLKGADDVCSHVCFSPEAKGISSLCAFASQ
eukprot:6143565-Amphidinium_carterae.1